MVDDVEVGPVMAESPVAKAHHLRQSHHQLPAQQSAAMRDSMALFLQVLGFFLDSLVTCMLL
jgi:hypothetical protein